MADNLKILQRHCIMLSLICLLLGCPPLYAELAPGMPPALQAVPPGEAAPANLPVERVSPGVFRIGSILLKKAERSVSFPALVNMDQGLLEYLLVRTGGKTHESLLRTAVEPRDLQVALLLLGLEGTSRPLVAQGAPELPTGEPVSVSISLSRPDGRVSEVNPAAWIVKKDGEALLAPGEINFVFTGSVMSGARFQAQAEGSIIAIYHDPAAIIDNASPGGESDRIWFANGAAAPAVGTPVTVTIKSLK
jgi:hypothetical protein